MRQDPGSQRLVAAFILWTPCSNTRACGAHAAGKRTRARAHAHAYARTHAHVHVRTIWQPAFLPASPLPFAIPPGSRLPPWPLAPGPSSSAYRRAQGRPSVPPQRPSLSRFASLPPAPHLLGLGRLDPALANCPHQLHDPGGGGGGGDGWARGGEGRGACAGEGGEALAPWKAWLGVRGTAGAHTRAQQVRLAKGFAPNMLPSRASCSAGRSSPNP